MKNYYLQQMGIEVWQLRKVTKPLTLNSVVESTANLQDKRDSQDGLIANTRANKILVLVTQRESYNRSSQKLASSSNFTKTMSGEPQFRDEVEFPNRFKQYSAAYSKFITQIFASVSIKPDDFDLIYLDSTINLTMFDLSLYKSVVIMGEFSQFAEDISREKLAVLPPQIKVMHPEDLLINPQKKRNVYLTLRQLELNYV